MSAEITSTANAYAHLGDPDWCFLDCRFDLLHPSAGYDSYLAGHIPGAVYAHLNDDLAGPILPGTGRHPLPAVSKLAATFGHFGIGKHTKVAVYDSGTGAIAARAWWLLRWMGHEQVSILDGGFGRWQVLELPIESGVVTRSAKEFIADLRQGLVVETRDLSAAIENAADIRLVDARDEARFEGRIEPIDKVAGHIPGAMNLPFTMCLNDDGTWLDPSDLRRVLAEVLGDELDAPWSVMCGSGVTACHLAVSGCLAGYPEPRLYVGSWSEWIQDPARPIA